MLFTPDLKKIDTLWHPDTFWPVRKRMTNAEYDAVWEELKAKVGAADVEPPFKGDEQIVTSSWIPGADLDGHSLRPDLPRGQREPGSRAPESRRTLFTRMPCGQAH